MANQALDHLFHAMNFDHWNIGDQHVIAFTDHRSAAVAIWAARKDHLFKKPPTLIRLDAHSDMSPADPVYNVDLEDETQAIAFANSMRGDDGSWVSTIARLGWIEHSACYYVRQLDQHHGDQVVTDINGQDHRIYNCGRLYSQLGHQGRLADVAYANENKQYFSDIGWSLKSQFRESDLEYWVDIDLDFATHCLIDFPTATWRTVDFDIEFLQKSRIQYGVFVGTTVADVFAQLLNKAKLITIAYEPRYCGGLHGATKILRELNRVFSDHGDWFNLYCLQDDF